MSNFCYFGVASLAEAWIETLSSGNMLMGWFVASLAEAWIETFSHMRALPGQRSPPSRRRGLKPMFRVVSFDNNSRLPRGGVD